jgi:hypothetical protein
MKKTDTKFPSGILLKTFLFSLLFYLLIGFNFQDSRTGVWIRQYITAPIGSALIRDIAFTDSLTGYALTSGDSLGRGYILNTITGGFNWSVIKTDSNWFTSVFALNKDTVFATPIRAILKSTDGGLSWTKIYLPGYSFANSFYALNTDTMWYACPAAPVLGGGLYHSTNGGINWQLQFSTMSGVTGYPQSIYMYNKNIGFMNTNHGELLKTTNSGLNWLLISTFTAWEFSDIYFSDSLKGYFANLELYKTTNGGLNWQKIIFPNVPGTNYTDKTIYKFSYSNDTIYTVGSSIEYTNPLRYFSIIYKSMNGGLNWGYQIPDTSFHIPNLHLVSFINGKTGWAYNSSYEYGGIHTTIGGDTTIYVGISNINSQIPNKFTLNQNYPNPFNPSTIISYYLNETGWVKLKIFDITGREMATLVNEVQGVGGYGVPLSIELPSGIYFYKMTLTTKNGIQMDTKKMVVVK